MAGRRARGVRPVRRPDPEPLEIDDSKVIAVGTALWAVAWVILLVFHNKLEDHGNDWWPWTAAAGLGLGLWGWFLTRRRSQGSTPAPSGSRRHRRAAP